MLRLSSIRALFYKTSMMTLQGKGYGGQTG